MCWSSVVRLDLRLPRLLQLNPPFPAPPRFSERTCSSAGGHPLCLRCLTMEMWRPKLRWTEQHSSQIRTPRLMLVHPGSDREAESDAVTSYIQHAGCDAEALRQHF